MRLLTKQLLTLAAFHGCIHTIIAFSAISRASVLNCRCVANKYGDGRTSKIQSCLEKMSASSLITTGTMVKNVNKRPSTSVCLWYRDRDETEEQMTSMTQLQATTTSTSNRNSNSHNQLGNSVFNMGAINIPLVKATCRSHIVAFVMALTVLSMAFFWNSGTFMIDISSLHWNSNSATIGILNDISNKIPPSIASTKFRNLFDWTLTPGRVLEGILATFPLVAMGSLMMEHSGEHRSTSHIHFSITNTVVALFGRRQQEQQHRQQSTMSFSSLGTGAASTTSAPTTTSTLQVILVSLGIATVSAVSEEIIYRGLLPVAILSYTHSVGLALLGQAVLFGLGQIRRQSSLAENYIFSHMQSIHGLWYGAVYLVTGGDLLPVILAHILYELHVFVGAWHNINNQLDYTKMASTSPLRRPHQQTKNISSNDGIVHPILTTPYREEWELEQIRKEAGGSLSPETFHFCRRFFYAFDYEHRGSLSRADVKRAVAYAFLQDSHDEQPGNAKVDKIFQKMIDRRRALSSGQRQRYDNNGDGKKKEERLYLPEFLRLLFELKSKKWQNQL